MKSISAVHSPGTYDLDELSNADTRRFPLLFKPDHAGGGRGIIQINSEEEFQIHQAANGDNGFEGVYEEFVTGDLYSLTLWFEDGKVLSYYGEREFVDADKFKVNASVTSNVIQAYLKSLRIPEALVEILAEFGLHQGYCHTQLLINRHGPWKIVECTLRLPGDLFPLNAQNFGSFPYSRMYLHTFQRGKGSLDCPMRAQFPDDSIYGRVMHSGDDSLKSAVKPFCSYRSHGEQSKDSYQVSYFKVPKTFDLADPKSIFE
jgi:hypothetical protein